ncbi:hypothetical protein Hanom_Chr11g01058821 [Helianthus anomalus]
MIVVYDCYWFIDIILVGNRCFMENFSYNYWTCSLYSFDRGPVLYSGVPSMAGAF